MTLEQMRYVVAISQYGSITAAAESLFMAQPSLSRAVKELEQELGITVFTRSNRGVTLTNDGTELLGYARQVIEQADMLEERYAPGEVNHARLSISTQHYAFSVQAFMNTIDQFPGDEYDFILRECATGEIIDDVRTFRSEAGILYLDDFNIRVLSKALADANIDFYHLFDAHVHVFVSENHPLAGKNVLSIDDLAAYPRYSFEQGTANSFYYAEEPLSHLPHKKNIRISDRGTLTNLLTHYSGYTLSTGVLSGEMHSGITSIPLDGAGIMHVGYIMHRERKPSKLLTSYIANLQDVVCANPTVTGVPAENAREPWDMDAANSGIRS